MNDTQIDRKAQELHEAAIVIDGHTDILIPVTEGKMILGDRVDVPDPATWDPPPGVDRAAFEKFGMLPHTIFFGCMGQYDIPRWHEGGVSAQVCAIFLSDDKLDDPFRRGMEMAYSLHHAVATYDDLELVTTAADIRRMKAEGKIGAILAFEGCEALGADIRFLDLYYALGLRVASLTHSRRNLFADGSWAAEQEGGLTPLGKKLVQRIFDLGIVLDLVHIGAKGLWEIMEMATQPMIMSHSTPTIFADTSGEPDSIIGGKLPRPRLELPRDREFLDALAANGGVLGLIWVAHRDLDSVVQDIETALDVMGPDHIGLGSDLYGAQLAPTGLEDISKVPAITRALVARGHDDETILKFLGGNYLRVFEAVWGK